MRFWVGFSDKMTTSEIRKNLNKPQVWKPYMVLGQASGYHLLNDKK